MSKIEVNEIAARSGTNISMTSGHTMQPNLHSSTTFPAGHVIQTVINTSTSNISTTSTTPQTVTTASITPKFATSTIHIEGFVSRLEIVYGSSNAYASLYLRDPSDSNITLGVSGNSSSSNSSPAAIFGTHSPNSTSSQTYTMLISIASGGTTSTSTDSQRYTIKLTEVAQ
jgi:hypothetical protein